MLFLEQPYPWNATEPTSQIVPRVFGCLKCIKEGEAERFSGSKQFRIRVVYHHQPPEEVTKALAKMAANAPEDVEIIWEPLHPD